MSANPRASSEPQLPDFARAASAERPPARPARHGSILSQPEPARLPLVKVPGFRTDKLEALLTVPPVQLPVTH